MIEPTRKARRARLPNYRFRNRVRAELGTLLPYHRNEQDEIDRRVVAHVREYGSVSNQTVQNLLQIGRPRASAILRNLSERRILQKTGDSPERGPTVATNPAPSSPAYGRLGAAEVRESPTTKRRHLLRRATRFRPSTSGRLRVAAYGASPEQT